MRLPDDTELLTEYATRQSEYAFTELVGRNVALVYSAALRQVREPQLAEEVTQAVFIILARKARAMSRHAHLAGWLCRVAYFVSRDALRTERRRQHRERILTPMENPADNDWTQIAPLLDEVVAQLNEKDRSAIVLRFYEQKSLGEVGAALGVDADAAQKRVSRALEKLRKMFTRRGVTLSATLIAGVVAANSVQAAPVGLAATVAAASAKGTTISITITTLVKGTMKTMTWLKLKFAIGAGVTALLAGGVATVAISQTGGGDNLTPQQIARQAQDAYAALSSYSDTGKNIATIAGQTITTTLSTKLQRPNLYRIDWAQSFDSTAFKGVVSKGVAWSDGTGDFWVTGAAGRENNARPEKVKDMQAALVSATAASSSMVTTIPEPFFNQNWGGMLNATDLTLKRQKDEGVNGVDCYVVSSSMDSGEAGKKTTTLWIGRQDHFIHKTQMIIEKMSVPTLPQASDADIKKVLEMQNKPATPEAIAAFRPILEKTLKETQKLMNSGRFVYTQTHGNISVNEKFPLSDFDR